MERQAVESKLLRSMGYDPEKKILEVQFMPSKKNPEGNIYQYEDVLQEDFDKLLAAESLGRHFLKHIQPNRTCTKIVPEKADENKTEAQAQV